MASLLLLMFFLAVAGIQASDGDSVTEVYTKLLENYVKSENPHTDGPTEVKINLYINNFYGISSDDMEYSMSFYLRQRWHDPRLAVPEDSGFTSIRAPDGAWNDIWTSDIFFRNEKRGEANEIMLGQRLLKMNDTGYIWYVTKLTSTLSCPMNLKKFPFDSQMCSIIFESFGHTTDTLTLGWLDTRVSHDPDIQYKDFTLTDTTTHNCTKSYSIGTYPCLQIKFAFARDVGYYVMAVFIPSIVLVVISWIQFWLDPSAVTGRVLIGLFCCFTLVGQMTGVRASLPRVSYLTSLDIWLTMCLLFTFCSLLQLAVVQRLALRQDEGLQEKPKTQRVDFVSRIAFPACFAAFCFLYFIINSVPSA